MATVIDLIERDLRSTVTARVFNKSHSAIVLSYFIFNIN